MRTLKAGAGRLIERILPKAVAEAGCPPDCYTEWSTSAQRCRRCCYSGATCKITCGSWDYC
ncbi:hypothetical protein OOK13_14055 [Streptomyces sp. NBC_00378]|uniref:hypothetical protein n=1 Tax=unclassified Streptomyces TaxID=2593676 RepID=UPI00224F23BA|nr:MULTISPECIES: hypothetical protein [unclassified Streptomyces]MCX5109643.1 hypothetical protein [Streptomyces sp. NBC_00378]